MSLMALIPFSLHKPFIDSVLSLPAYRNPREKALPIPTKDVRISPLEIGPRKVDLVPQTGDDPLRLTLAVHSFLEPRKEAMGPLSRKGIAESSTVLAERSIHYSRHVRNRYVIAEAAERIRPLSGFPIAIGPQQISVIFEQSCQATDSIDRKSILVF
jgi:hypothetical protein